MARREVDIDAVSSDHSGSDENRDGGAVSADASDGEERDGTYRDSAVGPGGESGGKVQQQKKKKRRPRSAPSDQTPRVYKVVRPKGEGASAKLLPRAAPKGTRRPADPRWLRAKLVEQQLDDLATKVEQDQTTRMRPTEQSRKGVATGLPTEALADEIGCEVELAEALHDLVIVSADGGRRWPVDKGGRIVLTSWPADEKWWQGFPERVLVSGPEEAGDIPREVVIRVSEKVQSEAEAAAKLAAERAAENLDATDGALTAEAERVEKAPEAVEKAAVDRSSAEAFRVAAVAVAGAKNYDYDEQLALGLQKIHAHRYREAIINFKRCRALEPTDPTACYNLACCYSLLRLSGLALRWLALAVELGLVDGGVLLQDTDLDNIRDAPRFKRLQQQLHRETTIVRPATPQGAKSEGHQAGLGRVRFSPSDEESEEEADLAAEIVDAHLLGFPLPSTPDKSNLGDRAATDRQDSNTPDAVLVQENDASTDASSQTDSDDEAEVVNLHRERTQRQHVKLKLRRRSKPKNSKLEPENQESAYHGVSWNRSSRLWQSLLPFEGQLKFIGQFDEETEAARAYDDAAHETFGADVHCNAHGIILNFSLSCGDCRTWAQACMAAGEPQEAVDWFEQALQDASEPSDEERPMVAYQLAGCYATCLDSSLAIRWFSNAVKWGLGTIRAADDLEPHTEAVFASIWKDARFLTICAKLDEARNGPARREHSRLVRRHRAARAAACVKSSVISTGGSDDQPVEHSSSPTLSSIDATNEPEAREQVNVNQQEHELDLFFEFWTENASSMNDLFGRLATRLIPLDLIRTTLRRVIGGLNLKSARIEACILNMLGLGTSDNDERGASGMLSAPSLFYTDIERVSRVASGAAQPGVKSGRVKMSASARHRSLKTEALCRAASPNQLPHGEAATVPVLARVVDREDFLFRCAAVAAAWSRAASRNARNEWLHDFEANVDATRYPTVDSTNRGKATALSDETRPGQTVTLDAARHRGSLAPAATETTISQSPGGLTVTDVNLPRGQGTPEKPAVVGDGQLILKPQDFSVSGGPLVGQQRWQNASDGLPANVRQHWTVTTVAAWLRALGLSDSVVGQAHEAQIDGARLLDAAQDPDPDACSRLADVLGLRTLGNRKLLGKAMTSLSHKADRLLSDSTTSPPHPPTADTFASLGSTASLAEEMFFQRLDWSTAGSEAEEPSQDQEHDLLLGRFGSPPRALSSQPTSPATLFSFGDVSSITTGL